MNGIHKELPYGNIALPFGSDSFHSAKTNMLMSNFTNL